MVNEMNSSSVDYLMEIAAWHPSMPLGGEARMDNRAHGKAVVYIYTRYEKGVQAAWPRSR
ncbi:hypothetical protein SAMN05216420_11454 [Nitrosospira sp. Nl5]|nr:hypothetical protein SAMN05216420_11454 [Nitrosospira sp. Nl5]